MTEHTADADTRIANALRYARFGDEEGEHHKTWVIDQMVRALTGCPDTETVANDWGGNPYTYTVQGESDAYREFTADTPLDPGIAP